MDVQTGGICGNSELVKLGMLVSTEMLYMSLLSVSFFHGILAKCNILLVRFKTFIATFLIDVGRCLLC
jgi:hypothetical protein